MEAMDNLALLGKTITANKEYVDICLKTDIGVVCVNRETGNSKKMPFKVMYENNRQFWLQNKQWEYYFSGDDLSKIRDIASAPGSTPADAAAPESGSEPKNWNSSPAAAEKDKIDQGFGMNYEYIAAMTEPQRVEHIKGCARLLDNLLVQKTKDKELVTEALVETAQDTMLHNHTALLNAMQLSDEEAKKQTQCLVDSTRDLVKTSSQLLSMNILNDELMNTLITKSNGTIIQHMTRVYMNGIAFLAYYNKLVTTSSIINKLRISLDKRQRDFYHSLMPHIGPSEITLERIFLGGMRAIPESDFYNWATGFMIHDIGKAAAVEYHEGEAAYNRDIVMEHIKVGYTSVMVKTNYPREAGIITGYHHEYYGDPAGYGYFRTYLEEHQKAHPFAKPGFFIAYNLEPVLSFEALGYFPAKVLEIIDVFDSVTDPNRKYRKAMTPEEALAMMEEEFINKHRKIDIILFDIFARFIREKQNA